VFASRLLHHAPSPEKVVEKLAALCRPGGALLVVDYARHEDESMRAQADLWLGFEEAELKRFARKAGLEEPKVTRIPAPRTGPDHHLIWQLLVARKRPRNGERHG
jgi:ArsR family transcriptional regulator